MSTIRFRLVASPSSTRAPSLKINTGTCSTHPSPSSRSPSIHCKNDQSPYIKVRPRSNVVIGNTRAIQIRLHPKACSPGYSRSTLMVFRRNLRNALNSTSPYDLISRSAAAARCGARDTRRMKTSARRTTASLPVNQVHRPNRSSYSSRSARIGSTSEARRAGANVDCSVISSSGIAMTGKSA